MENKAKFTSKSLLEIMFEKNVKGYNALQVDQTLDEIIADYKMYEEKALESEKVIAKLQLEVVELKEKIRNNEIELAESKFKFKSLPKDLNVSQDNVALLKRIDALERALYQKGVDPKKI